VDYNDKRFLKSGTLQELRYNYIRKVVYMKNGLMILFIVASVALMISCATSSGAAAPAPAPSAPVVNLDEARARAEAAREQALSIKADVAVKADFDNAANIFAGANSVETFLQAETLFIDAYDNAKILRDAALLELEKARAEIKNAEDDAAAFEAEQAENEAAEGAL
jgi:hypothetical protein